MQQFALSVETESKDIMLCGIVFMNFVWMRLGAHERKAFPTSIFFRTICWDFYSKLFCRKRISCGLCLHMPNSKKLRPPGFSNFGICLQPVCTSPQIWCLPRSGDFWGSFLPSFCFESFGGTSGDSHEFTKKLISSISTRLSEPKSVVAISFYEKNSCILIPRVLFGLTSAVLCMLWMMNKNNI